MLDSLEEALDINIFNRQEELHQKIYNAANSGSANENPTFDQQENGGQESLTVKVTNDQEINENPILGGISNLFTEESEEGECQKTF